MASKEGYTEIVDILLQKGVDPNLVNTVRMYTMFHPKANHVHVYTSLILIVELSVDPFLSSSQ